MPALFFHYKLGQDLLSNTLSNIRNEISQNINYYNMFNQGWDNLYYHFPKWNYYKSVGNRSHKKNVAIFFENAINYIKNNNLENDSKYSNLIYGILNHYTMDTLIHPFVNYQVKHLKLSHTKVEFMMDSIIKNNYNNKIYKTIIPKIKFDKKYLDFINYIYNKTYKINNIGKVWQRSHNNGYILYRYFINDKHGIKAFLYRIIDVFNFSDFKLHENTFYVKKFDNKLLNNNKSNWNNPNDKDNIYNYSLEELYNNTLKICIKANKIAYKVLHKNNNIQELLDYIKNLNIKNMQELLQK